MYIYINYKYQMFNESMETTHTVCITLSYAQSLVT